MIFPTLLLCTFLVGGEKVVINEFSYDDSGTDDREFVELYNASNKDIDISGWKLESNDQVGANTGFTDSPQDHPSPKGDVLRLRFEHSCQTSNQTVGSHRHLGEQSGVDLILKSMRTATSWTRLTLRSQQGRNWATRQVRRVRAIWGNLTIDRRDRDVLVPHAVTDTTRTRTATFAWQPSTPGKTRTT